MAKWTRVRRPELWFPDHLSALSPSVIFQMKETADFCRMSHAGFVHLASPAPSMKSVASSRGREVSISHTPGISCRSLSSHFTLSCRVSAQDHSSCCTEVDLQGHLEQKFELASCFFGS